MNWFWSCTYKCTYMSVKSKWIICLSVESTDFQNGKKNCQSAQQSPPKECNCRHPGFFYQLVDERWGIPHVLLYWSWLIRMFSASTRRWDETTSFCARGNKASSFPNLKADQLVSSLPSDSSHSSWKGTTLGATMSSLLFPAPVLHPPAVKVTAVLEQPPRSHGTCTKTAALPFVAKWKKSGQGDQVQGCLLNDGRLMGSTEDEHTGREWRLQVISLIAGRWGRLGRHAPTNLAPNKFDAVVKFSNLLKIPRTLMKPSAPRVLNGLQDQLTAPQTGLD